MSGTALTEKPMDDNAIGTAGSEVCDDWAADDGVDALADSRTALRPRTGARSPRTWTG